MDGTSSEKPAEQLEKEPDPQSTSKVETKPLAVVESAVSKPRKTTKTKKVKKPRKSEPEKSKHTKKHSKHESSSDSSSSDSEEDESEQDTTSSSESSSSEDNRARRKKLRKRKALKKKQKQKRSKRREEHDSDSASDDSDVSDSGSDSSSGDGRRTKRGKAKRRTIIYDSELEDDEEYDEDDNEDDQAANYGAKFQAQIQAQVQAQVQAQLAALQLGQRRATQGKRKSDKADHLEVKNKKKKKAAKRASKLDYKRVDQIWDSTIHDYKLTESAKEKDDEFDQYVFTVRRRFDWENRYKNTVVDIKSKLLKEALQEVLADVKSVSLVEDQPSVDPNMLFMYLEELREYYKTSLKRKIKKENKRKFQKRLKMMKSHVKILVSYLNHDYEETKKTLYPMLEAGNITFELLWALFKPNSIAYTTTYGATDHPRCFKVDYATKESSFMRGEWYCMEGRYLEYDGKSFGLGDFEVDVDSFKGPRKITSLATYPLAYHKDPDGLSKRLIERGKSFVSMEGMNYRFHKGLAFMKKKKTVQKVNIHGRIMVDPAIFRRINPNYPISFIKPNWVDEDNDRDGSDDERCSCTDCDDDGEAGESPQAQGMETETGDRTTRKIVFDKQGKPQVVEISLDADGQEIHVESIDKLPEGTDPAQKKEFTDEELLIASPVVLGFAFNEKLWLEFSLSEVSEIEWNEGAFESLVLPPNQKSIVKALVESHKFHAAKTIDDVVQGKGKGLVAVLHGSPGTGKTLTAEGIAELLKCPLYMVSAGELGTDPRILEHELQKILDIAHSWGAVLLLDEADVFLEKRQIHDIHRNALVSIFLRLLEYFQGILFLTTNRVETFDDAFQSRIHVALRYGELTGKAKKAVWKMFLEKVRIMEGVETETFKDGELEMLSRNNLNGRQIKNAVRTAQALAVNEHCKLSMEHIKRVLDVAESFEQDLKGGSGYKDAMRSYT